jgi:hypothetical protein
MTTREEVLALAKEPLTEQQVDAIIRIVEETPLTKKNLAGVVRIVEQMNW